MAKKILTKQQALKDCIKLWQHIADNPMVGKTRARVKVLPHKMYYNECPCCEYLAQFDRSCGSLSTCLLTWSEYGTDYACLKSDSPYSLWVDSDSAIEKQTYALEIVKLAEDALAKLED